MSNDSSPKFRMSDLKVPGSDATVTKTKKRGRPKTVKKAATKAAPAEPPMPSTLGEIPPNPKSKAAQVAQNIRWALTKANETEVVDFVRAQMLNNPSFVDHLGRPDEINVAKII